MTRRRGPDSQNTLNHDTDSASVCFGLFTHLGKTQLPLSYLWVWLKKTPNICQTELAVIFISRLIGLALFEDFDNYSNLPMISQNMGCRTHSANCLVFSGRKLVTICILGIINTWIPKWCNSRLQVFTVSEYLQFRSTSTSPRKTLAEHVYVSFRRKRSFMKISLLAKQSGLKNYF